MTERSKCYDCGGCEVSKKIRSDKRFLIPKNFFRLRTIHLTSWRQQENCHVHPLIRLSLFYMMIQMNVIPSTVATASWSCCIFDETRLLGDVGRLTISYSTHHVDVRNQEHSISPKNTNALSLFLLFSSTSKFSVSNSLFGLQNPVSFFCLSSTWAFMHELRCFITIYKRRWNIFFVALPRRQCASPPPPWNSLLSS